MEHDAPKPAAMGGDLPRRTRLAYASAGLGAEALAQSRNLWLLYYYAPPEEPEEPPPPPPPPPPSDDDDRQGDN